MNGSYGGYGTPYGLSASDVLLAPLNFWSWVAGKATTPAAPPTLREQYEAQQSALNAGIARMQAPPTPAPAPAPAPMFAPQPMPFAPAPPAPPAPPAAWDLPAEDGDDGLILGIPAPYVYAGGALALVLLVGLVALPRRSRR